MPLGTHRPQQPPAPEVTVHHKDDRIQNFYAFDWWVRVLLIIVVILLAMIFTAQFAHGQQGQVPPAGLYWWNGTEWVPANATNPLPVSATISGANPCASATGSAVPAQSCYFAVNVGGILNGVTGVNPTGSVIAAQVDLTSLGGVSFGAMANYGTSPGAVKVPGVNAFVTNTVTVGGSGIFQVAPTTSANTLANPFFTELSDGTNLIGVSAHPVRTDPTGTTTQPVSGTVTANQGGTWTVQPGNTPNTSPWLTTPTPGSGSSVAVSPCNILSTASTNATNCKNAAGNFYGFDVYNTTTTVYYLRLYNTSASPTCSSSTGFIRSIPIPPGAASGLVAGIVSNQTFPVNYSTGISYCITGGSSSTDNTNAAAGIFGEIRYQ